ncbi:NAD(P)-dependent alcohol dehydrogenase [Salinibacter sp. 10B]|uniref:NAD(P)-dependent alcohol dehydrogenase n=1 Tax=Salinibacter sp. 10B TaxID=1923971 RepID=UPI000CF569CE|nr:NAD(P)-dependent alcohol dehydrogenase [Salinibacter sp. 10B]PQJ26962.1 NAD(P)-dependent alcohol dehydrogenase [Salinibacter sp. 10B]
MKAVLAPEYGSPDVLQIADVPKPSIRKNEVLIRVRAATVSSGDSRVRSLTVPTGFKLLSRLLFGIMRPRQPILGTEFSGEIEAVGEDVKRFGVGDSVFAYSDGKMGAHAEYVAMPEEGPLAHKPPNLTYEEAAALSFGGVTALRFLQWGGLQEGETVLVNGASGSVGTAAVQLARHFGASVTGVCSTGNVEWVQSLGAHRVIDYTKEDVREIGDVYDVIVDTAGTLPYSRSKHLLRDGGRLLLVLGSLPDMLRAPWVALTSTKRVVAGAASGRREDMEFLASLAESGAFTPVIDRSYPLEHIADAYRYVEQGHKKGNVVLTVASTNGSRPHTARRRNKNHAQPS